MFALQTFKCLIIFSLWFFPLSSNCHLLCSTGARYIVMGQIFHRRRHLPSDLLTLVAGKLKPGDGLLRSSNYVKRFNKRRHQKALEAVRSRCR
uniref:Chromosome 17 open reading frame 58 n=1 Tax=Cyprinodon variegatus TaxID=28743 RepID=A0A3Q2GH03_CYPVA